MASWKLPIIALAAAALLAGALRRDDMKILDLSDLFETKAADGEALSLLQAGAEAHRGANDGTSQHGSGAIVGWDGELKVPASAPADPSGKVLAVVDWRGEAEF